MTLNLEMFSVWKAPAWPALGHTIDLTRPLFIEVIMLSQQSEGSSIYVRNIYCASLYGFDIWFWPRSDRVVYFVFHFISISTNFYTDYCQQMCFWLELDLKNWISITSGIMPHTLHHICPIVKVCWQQVMVLTENTFNISFRLNIRNTVFNTNFEELPFEIIHFILFFSKNYIYFCKWSNPLPVIGIL